MLCATFSKAPWNIPKNHRKRGSRSLMSRMRTYPTTLSSGSKTGSNQRKTCAKPSTEYIWEMSHAVAKTTTMEPSNMVSQVKLKGAPTPPLA